MDLCERLRVLEAESAGAPLVSVADANASWESSGMGEAGPAEDWADGEHEGFREEGSPRGEEEWQVL